MKNLLIFLILLLLNPITSRSQNTLILNPEIKGAKINKNIYGHFAEHLGHCIYGGIYVGKNSDIPNQNGYRNDVVNALKEMKIPLLRWPGGCFADTYHWKEGIGPQEKRSSIVNVHWGGVTEDNSFGTHEFLNFCELIGAEPYINLNVGSGTVQEAADWVEYVTSSGDSPMTRLRKENGREKPWNVKYWAVGNETWGCGGNMRPEYYSDLYRHYATFLRGPGIYRIASGANSDDYHWTEVLMRESAGHFNGISLHYYTIPNNWNRKGSATQFDEAEWFNTLSNTLRMEELVTRHSNIMDRYDPQKRVGLLVDEWGAWYDVEPGTNPGFLFQQNTLRDALIAGINLNIFNNHADRVTMSNIAQMINVLQSVILTKEKEMVLTPTYYLFKLYSVHQDAMLIPVSLKCENYSFGNRSIPSLNASASVKDGVISLTICNLNPSRESKLKLSLNGIGKGTATAQVITGNSMNSCNNFGSREEVRINSLKEMKIADGMIETTLPAKSITLIQIRQPD